MAKGKSVLRVYKSYNFREKDPVIDALRTAVSDSNLSYKKLHELSNVSNSTMTNWFMGRTKRPMFCTVWAVARACGKRGITMGKDGVPKFLD